MHTQTAIQYHGAIDIAKSFFSFCILALHSAAFPSYYYPIFRLAVPFFFLASSYFLFLKVQNASNPASVIKAYIWRNLKLYLIWFLLLLPITLLVRNWFHGSFLWGLLRFVRSFLFGSTFIASWYIMATIWGTLIIYGLSKKLEIKLCIFLSIPLYALCCLFTNYGGLLNSTDLGQAFSKYYQLFFGSPASGFPAALVWIAMGKYFAQTPSQALPSRKKTLFALFGSLCLFIAEVILVETSGWRKADDCYITLIPVSFFLFALLLQSKITISFGKSLRKICTLTFVTHASFKPCLSYIAKLLIPDARLIPQLVFLGMVALCMSFSCLVLVMERHPRLRWLRHLY